MRAAVANIQFVLQEINEEAPAIGNCQACECLLTSAAFPVQVVGCDLVLTPNIHESRIAIAQPYMTYDFGEIVFEVVVLRAQRMIPPLS